MTQLALAYRIIDDRRGFLDIYAGARYNYLGINMGSGLDSSNLSQIATDATDGLSAQSAHAWRAPWPLKSRNSWPRWPTKRPS